MATKKTATKKPTVVQVEKVKTLKYWNYELELDEGNIRVYRWDNDESDFAEDEWSFGKDDIEAVSMLLAHYLNNK